jgi:hypothetical protein
MRGVMDYADWRNHSGYILVRVRSGMFGRMRYSVLRGKSVLGTFSDPIRAELFIDEALARGRADEVVPAP